MQPELLRIAASLRVAYLSDPVLLQNVFAAVDETERRRLIEAGTIRLSDHARRTSDGHGDGVSCCANKNGND